MSLYGEGGWGLGPYGGQLDLGNERAAIDAFIDVPIGIEPGSNLDKLVASLITQANRIEDEANSIQDAHHVADASGEQLDMLGALVGVTRQENESDDHYRQRIKVVGHASVSTCTTNEMMLLSSVALEEPLDNITFPIDLSTNPGQFDVEVPASVVSDAALTESEIEDACQQSLPAGHQYVLTTT